MKPLKLKLFWSSTTSRLESYALIVIRNICGSENISRTVTCCVVIAVAVVMSSCGGDKTPIPIMTVSKPKYYADDQVLKIMAGRRAQIRELSKGIPGEGIQESLGIKQTVSNQFNIAAASPTGGSPVTPPPPLPAAPSVPASAPGEKLQQDFSTALRKKIVTDQEITGYELLYLGDTQLLNDEKKVALLGFNISLNKAFPREESDEFAVVHFKVFRPRENGEWEPNDLNCAKNIWVYAILPEMSSILASESLESATLTELAAQIGGGFHGLDAQAAARLQRTLNESLSTLLDVPMQFGIYEREKNTFTVAFGPRRKPKKKHWFLRLIGADPYEIEYYIPAGTKACYALILMDKSIEKLGVYAYCSGEILELPKYESEAEKSSDPLSKAGSFDYKSSAFSRVSAFSGAIEPNKKSKKPDFEIDIKIPPSEASGVFPNYLYPESTNTFLIVSKKPVSAETDVFIGPVAVAKDKIEVLGRKRLRVTIPPDERLKKLQDPNVVIDVILVQPDEDFEKLTLKVCAAQPKKEPRVVAQPREVWPGQAVELSRNDETLNLLEVKTIKISAMKEISSNEFHTQSKDKITFSAPIEGTPHAGTPLTIDLIFEQNGKSNKISIPNAIVYNKLI